MEAIKPTAVYRGDNRATLAGFPSESVDLVYLDPPFFSNRQYEVIWGEEAEIRSFEDRWAGGIHVYVEWMRERLLELHRLLKPTGSLYLHCDSSASHYLKVALDDIFGREQFRNEIIWQRTGAHSDAKRFGRVTDTVLFYTRSSRYTFNAQYTPYDPAYVAERYRYLDPDGRRYWANTMTAAGPGPIRSFRGAEMNPPKGTHWRFSQPEIDRMEAEGRIYYSRTGMPYVKSYLDERKGRAVQNLWTDIVMSKSGAERIGYPTQKPVALLKRIIEASSNPGDLVLDPFCGCGTTLEAAQLLDRRWAGIDISPTACLLMKDRLAKVGAVATLERMPVSDADLRTLKPFEFQNMVVTRMYGTHAPRKSGDMGIDGFSWFEHLPIQVKQSESIGRNVVDNFETAIERSGRKAGYIVGFSFTRGAAEEAARVRVAKGIDIRLTPVAELFSDKPPRYLRLPETPPDYVPRQDLPTAEELIASERGLPALMQRLEDAVEESRAVPLRRVAERKAG